MAQIVKNLPSMWQIQVWSLGWKDPLKREWPLTLVFSILAWRITWKQRSLGGYSPWGHMNMTKWLTVSLSLFHYAFHLPDSSVGKESVCNAGDPGSIAGSGRSPGEGIGYPLQYSWASLVAQLVKNLPAMWETWVRSLGWEDPLEKGRATNSSILA